MKCDRISHIIMLGSCAGESRKRWDNFLGRDQKRVACQAEAPDGVRQDTGRLKQTPHPGALTIVRPVPSDQPRYPIENQHIAGIINVFKKLLI